METIKIKYKFDLSPVYTLKEKICQNRVNSLKRYIAAATKLYNFSRMFVKHKNVTKKLFKSIFVKVSTCKPVVVQNVECFKLALKFCFYFYKVNQKLTLLK